MTRFAFTAEPDEYGLADPAARGRRAARARPARIAAPRRPSRTWRRTRPPSTPAATTPTHYIVDRVARTTSYEVVNDGTPSVFELRDAVLDDAADNAVSLRVIGHSRTFYDGEPYSGLPLGRLGDHGLAVRARRWPSPTASSTSCSTRGSARLGPRPPTSTRPARPRGRPSIPAEFRDLMPELAGYRHYADADVPGSPGGYYIVGARHRYDVHDHDRVPRGLLLGSLDPFGAESRVELRRARPAPDRRRSTRSGSPPAAVNDLRVLQPRRGHRRQRQHQPSVDVLARPGSSPPASCAARTARATPTVPSVRMEYDLLAFAERGQPVSVRTVAPGAPRHPDRRARRASATTRSSRSSTPTGSVACCRPAAQAEDVLFGDPVFGGGVIPADQTAPVPATVGRDPADRRSGQRGRQRLAGLRQQGPGRREVRAVLRHRLRLRRRRSTPSSAGRRPCSTTRAASRSARVNPDGSEQRRRASGSRSTWPTPTCSRRRRGRPSPTTPTTTPGAPTAPPPRRTATTGTPRPASRSTPSAAPSSPSPATAPTPTGLVRHPVQPTTSRAT